MDQASQRRANLINELTELAHEELDSAAQAEQFIDFIKVAVHPYPADEIFQLSARDVFGAFHGLFEFVQHTGTDLPEVRVFNPTLEEDGWLSHNTVIYVAQRDMPFLVDSIRILLNRRNLNIHIVHSNPVEVVRDNNGDFVRLGSAADGDSKPEAYAYFEIDLHSDEADLDDLTRAVLDTLKAVEMAVDDYRPMQQRMAELIDEIAATDEDDDDTRELVEFLTRLRDGYYSLLGCCEYRWVDKEGTRYMEEVPEQRLGLLKMSADIPPRAFDDLSQGARDLHDSNERIAFTKSSVRSQVHRDVHSDYVVIKRVDEHGESAGEVRFLGLFASPIYMLSCRNIPFLRRKVTRVQELIGIRHDSHDGKTMRAILDTLPREELLQSSVEDLRKTVLGIWRIQERRVVRLFARPDSFERYVSCLVYLPRETYRSSTRERIHDMLVQELDGEESVFTSIFPADSVLARTHFTIRVRSTKFKQVDWAYLERRVVQITRDWEDVFTDAAIEHWGEEEGRNMVRRYCRSFQSAYQYEYEPREAIRDIGFFHHLNADDPLALHFYHPGGEDENLFRFRMFSFNKPIELSDLIPLLENFGFHVKVEQPFRIASGDHQIWLHDFQLELVLDVSVDAAELNKIFTDAFMATWRREAENDSFNRLVLGAGMAWRSVMVIRAYARYIKQLGVAYSQEFIADTLSRHLEITRNLVSVFSTRFDLDFEGDRDAESQRLLDAVQQQLESVTNISEDRVLALFCSLLKATLRTNFYQTDSDGRHKPYMSFKLATRQIEEAPRPRPAFEIFVYSSRMEGVHLRGGKVARGGLRWSDRLEDYRTEVLGLVKAQTVKNSVIVPTGAKGGFVAKNSALQADRKAWGDEGIACYKMFIRGLLDITDNLSGDEVMPPKQVIRRDEDDPYLVVAADKGTARFSDIANELSEQYGHWLGDAFASGGSNGYDHKGMGITARGAWVAVQRHFREKGMNIQEAPFTVVGIGDMAGDVFGNGMLLSEQICLLAAFNHLHIFVDPNPDPAATFAERKRLFDAVSGWGEYDQSLLSEGGMIFSRQSKTLQLTPQIKQRFGIVQDQLSPNELIKVLLQAEVDLIWNGGIGTYVKSSRQNNADVGDRANDAVRVDGDQLRCKVFGEGGNLGMTQAGRIEYNLHGGICNTDAIDNAAGVDCSDHEVNIKILLNALVAGEDLTGKQRNALLAEMTDEVAELVLDNNYRQTQAISLASQQGDRNLVDFQRFMQWLEGQGKLDRQLEGLPSDDDIAERTRLGKGLTRPELSVLISYAKIVLKESLLASPAMDDPYLQDWLPKEFPKALVKQFKEQVYRHPLRREIIATLVANDMVDRMGITFYFRQVESTGARLDEIALAYVIAMELHNTDQYWEQIEEADYKLPADVQLDMLSHLVRLIRRSTRWLLRNRRGRLVPNTILGNMQEPVKTIRDNVADFHQGEWNRLWKLELDTFLKREVDDELAKVVSTCDTMYLATGVVDTMLRLNQPIERVARCYFALGDVLALDWFMSMIVNMSPKNRWEDFARESFVDDLENQRRMLSYNLLKVDAETDPEQVVANWKEEQSLLVGRWHDMIRELQSASVKEFTMVSVALRELLDLVQATNLSIQE